MKTTPAAEDVIMFEKQPLLFQRESGDEFTLFLLNGTE